MKHRMRGGHVRDRVDVEAEHVQVAGQVIEHGHSSPLHDSVRSQLDGLKRAEVHVGNLLVESIVQCPLGACGTQGTVEEEFDGAHTTKSVFKFNVSTWFGLLGYGASNTTQSCSQ